MKRTLLCLLVAMLVLTPALAQDQETWINTNDDLSALLPGGMLLNVSHGLSYDEWDIIFRSPSELSNYTGIGVLTAYGNYEWPTSPWNNPFISGPMTIGDILFGVTTDMFGVRVGALAGYRLNQTGNINKTAEINAVGLPTIGNVLTEWTYSNEVVVDAAGDIGTADYNYSSEVAVTDYVSTKQASFVGGVNLGFIGVSLLGAQTLQSRRFGGTVDYTWTPGETTTPNDQITSATIRYGGDEQGRVRGYPDPAQSINIQALGDLPFTLLGYSAPITMRAGFSLDTNTPLYNAPVRYALTTGNPALAAQTTDTSTLTMTVGDTNLAVGGSQMVFNNAWFTAINAYEDATLTEAELITAATDQTNNWALDGGSGGNTRVTLGGKIDPSVALAEHVYLRTRVGLGVELGRNHNPRSGLYETELLLANGAATNSVYTESGTISGNRTTWTTSFAPELGGVFDLRSADQRLSLKTGLFYLPELTFGRVNWDDQTTTIRRSWTDATGTDADAPAGTANPALIGPGDFQGSSTSTTETSYTAAGTDNTIDHAFAVPVSVSFDLVPTRWTMTAGYRADHSITTRYQVVPDAESTTTNTVANSAGTTVSPVVTTTSVASVVRGESRKSTTASPWTGSMDFMVRWTPTESMTLDFYGEWLVDWALDFDLFFFNPSDFLTNLGISASFRF